MHATPSGLIYSATDLSRYLACAESSWLDRTAALGGPRPPRFEDPAAEVLRRRGAEHERDYLERLRSEAPGEVVSIVEDSPDLAPRARWSLGHDRTVETMRAGARVLYQAVLFDGTWLGRPDFLVRVDSPSALGRWSYEVVDTKLARGAKAGAVLQVSLYSELLAMTQGATPERMHLALGGPAARTESFRFLDYAAFYRSVKRRFEREMAAVATDRPIPEPVEHCGVCDWRGRCDGVRRAADHLSLVAGISRRQRTALEARGIDTTARLAAWPLPATPPLRGVTPAALERVREQARIQVEGRVAGEPIYELLARPDVPPGPDQGLAMLPEPSPLDLFFDLEGDPFALGEGLEYLFGWVDREGRYTARWAFERPAEKAAFEAFVDEAVSRLDRDPGFHVYHFAPYEPTALKRLMARFATRENEVDRLLRGKVLVDLHRVVRQAMRASVESYSIKKLEPLYGYERAVDLATARAALAHFEAWLAFGRPDERDEPLLERIAGYNRDDCLSTLRLQEWTEGLREALAQRVGSAIPRPTLADPAPSEELSEHTARVAAIVERLTEDVPTDEGARSPEQHARWLLAHLLEWHRREAKSVWWEHYRAMALKGEELVEDRATLGELVYLGVVEEVRRSLVHRYGFPPQEHGFQVGKDTRDPATGKSAGKVVAIDDLARTIDLVRAKRSDAPHPAALAPFDHVPDGVLRESLLRLADAVAEHGLGDGNPHRAACDLLLRHPPRVGGPPGAALASAGEDVAIAARRLALALDRSVLPIQGPPGAGKTHTGARMILTLLRSGKRVGVTATSHKVIENLLDETCAAARDEGYDLTGLQRAEGEQASRSEEITVTRSNDEVAAALADGSTRLAAGTAWLWSRPEMAGSVDVLFIDEAGQLSLANALAMAQAAGSLVLLGDPRQLEQPQRGLHPPGAGVSALEHVLGDDATVPPERGLFFPETWRLHPEICAFTSEAFYRGRLRSRPGLERQSVSIGGALAGGVEGGLAGAGLRLVPIVHEDNQNESPEEAEAIGRLVRSFLEHGVTWTDKEGRIRPLTLEDVLVVAPYNVQVAALIEALPHGSRVGTVDRFQGQEAPIVVYSMTSSSAEDAPRGMEFLYDPNRLNVATSRARCLAVVVASPRLLVPEARSPRQMELANVLCRYAEMASR